MLNVCGSTFNARSVFSSPSGYFSSIPMKGHVLTLSHKLEVFKSIIMFYSIDVMNALIGSKFSTNVLFHHPNVLKNPTISFIYSNITSNIFNWLEAIKGFLTRFKSFSSLPTSTMHTTHRTTSFNTNDLFTSINFTYFHKDIIAKTICVNKENL